MIKLSKIGTNEWTTPRVRVSPQRNVTRYKNAPEASLDRSRSSDHWPLCCGWAAVQCVGGAAVLSWAMGCASSSTALATPEEMATRVMILAQRQGKRCTASLAIAGARFLPGKPAHEVWAWLQDPVLIPSYNRPPEWPAFVEDHVIEIAVPATYHRADVSSGLLGTTIVLPSGACVKIRLPDGCGAGQVVAEHLDVNARARQ